MDAEEKISDENGLHSQMLAKVQVLYELKNVLWV